MKRRNLVLTGLLMSVLALGVGCGKKESTDNGDNGAKEPAKETKVTVDFWHGYSADKAEPLKEMIAKFETENPNIDINEKFVANGEEILQKVQGAIVADELPDLLWGYPTWTGVLESSGKLVNMGKLMDDAYKADLPEGVLNAGQYNGEVYSVPIEAGTLYMIYNKDMFEEAGIEKVPTTWEELYTTAKALTNDKHKGIWLPTAPNERTTWTWETFLWQTGGDLLNADFTELAFSREQGLKALDYYTKMITEGYAPKSIGQGVDPFVNKEVAIIYGTQGAANSYINKQKMNVGVAMLPADKRLATGLGSNHYYMFDNKDQAKQDAAFTFVKWMTTGKNNAEWAIKSGYLPVSLSARDSEEYKAYGKENPQMTAAAEALQYGIARPLIQEYNKISDAISGTIEKIAFGEMNAEDGIDSIMETMNKIIKK